MPDCQLNVGTGAVQFRCQIKPDGHRGPCACPEVPVSQIRREQWLRANQEAPASTVVDVDVSVPDGTSTDPNPGARVLGVSSPAAVIEAPDGTPRSASHITVTAFADLEGPVRDLMRRDLASLPPALAAWHTGATAQVCLNHLWQQASAAFEAGAESIVLTRADVERLVPERLRSP